MADNDKAKNISDQMGLSDVDILADLLQFDSMNWDLLNSANPDLYGLEGEEDEEPDEFDVINSFGNMW